MCVCLFRHPRTRRERREVVRALDYARSVGDSVGVTVALTQLTGRCPRRRS